jgi:hypothetical protein
MGTSLAMIDAAHRHLESAIETRDYEGEQTRS